MQIYRIVDVLQTLSVIVFSDKNTGKQIYNANTTHCIDLYWYITFCHCGGLSLHYDVKHIPCMILLIKSLYHIASMTSH